MAIETVHNIHELWPTDYIAFDEIQSVTEFSSMYSTEEGADFFKRFQRKKAEVPLKALAIYAKPVSNKHGPSVASRNLENGQQVGVRSIPTVFVNGKILKNRALKGFQQMIEAELKRSR